MNEAMPEDSRPKRTLSLAMAAPSGGQIDPVCGMTVDPASAPARVVHEGKSYYFCCPGCALKFEADPARYLHPSASPRPQIGEPRTNIPGEAGAAIEYTCPMHPEVIRMGPGSCPLCGMALEPRIVTAEEPTNPELIDMTRRFWVGLVLSIPIFVLSMADMISGQPLHLVDMRLINCIQLVLASPVVLWCGWPFFVRAWDSLLHRSPNMFTLIALGVGASFVYSLVATVAPRIFPEGFRMAGGAVATYFDTAAVVTVLVLLGQVLELRARARASGAIRKLLGMTPKTARIIRAGGHEDDIPLDDVAAGDSLRVRPGERVPADGTVSDGNSAVDESMISGEPIPVEKETGNKVIAGSVNGTGTLVIRVDRVGSGTLLAQIVRMVTEAQRSRAPVERLVDKVSRYFVPSVLLVALVSFVVWGTCGPPPSWAHALVNAVAVLIIACPCALGLATPLAIMVGTGKGAETGVLVKNAEVLEVLGKADILVVDKTGTLTEGKPVVAAIECEEGFNENALLCLAAALERASEHPLAGAIVKAAQARELALPAAQDFQSITGKGVTGKVKGQRVALGNQALLADLGVDAGRLRARVDALRSEGHTVILAAVDGDLAGLISVADPIRATTPEAIELLREDGLSLVMLTGDARTTAEAVARKLNIAQVIPEVLPQQKHEVVQQLQSRGHVVAMAGDGINDAPALARANVGIALGTGTDVAIESAGATLVHGDLRAVARARRLSRATMRNIRENLLLAFLYNTLTVPVAAGLLYPLTGVLISPIWASVAMSLSSLSVVGNALRLRRVSL
jgi:Cu+-exporting ATPase